MPIHDLADLILMQMARESKENLKEHKEEGLSYQLVTYYHSV